MLCLVLKENGLFSLPLTSALNQHRNCKIVSAHEDGFSIFLLYLYTGTIHQNLSS